MLGQQRVAIERARLKRSVSVAWRFTKAENQFSLD
jgi:hypothetical protein